MNSLRFESKLDGIFQVWKMDFVVIIDALKINNLYIYMLWYIKNIKVEPYILNT